MMDRETLRARIRSLLEKTTARGCTEAEAMAAAEKAAELMRKAGLSEADLNIGEHGGRIRSKGRTAASRLWPIIAHCTNTMSVTVIDDDGAEVLFIGREPGAEIAAYLRDICDRAIARGVREFKAGKFYRRRRSLATKRQAVADFTEGMVIRISTRLLELFKPLFNEEARTAAENALEQRYPNSVSVRRKEHKERFSQAANDGWAAGGSVPLNRGVGEDAPTAALEGGR